MLYSMTAYSRIQKKLKELEVGIEIISVNKRTLDVQMKLPAELSFLEHDLRKTISQEVARGMLTVRVQAFFRDEAPVDVRLNRPLIEKIQSQLPEVNLANITALLPPGYWLLELLPIAKNGKEITAALKEALSQLNEMRKKEGAALEKDFLKRLKTLDACVGTIEKQSKVSVEKAKKKLIALLGSEMDEKVAKEVVVFADKVDICEEIVRFRLHLESFRQTMKKEQAAGKKLEFILQELLREANTMGSKSQDGLISEQVIEIKCELEKIREQVQNVE